MGRRVLSAAVALAWLAAAPSGAPQALEPGGAPSVLKVAEAYGKLPLTFEANQGQTDRRVRFLSRGSGYTLLLTSNEAVLVLGKGGLRMKLAGANPRPRVTGVNELPGRSHYFIGKDRSKWRANIPSYSKVRYVDVYPGVDLVYYGTQRQLEYDFVVAPGADPGRIALAFEGASELRVDDRGDLVLHLDGGEIRLRRPLAYQEKDGVRQEVSCRYALKGQAEPVGARRVEFEVGAYDPSRPLVIDPVLVYSTFLGGSGVAGDQAFAIAVDASGHAYVTGATPSADFPTTAGASQETMSGGSHDVFVTKLDPAGSALVYSTFLGGSRNEFGAGIAVDASGNAYVTGQTVSRDFPTTPGAFDVTANDPPAPNTDHDAFVTKLNPTGSALVYSTYLGGARGPGNTTSGTDEAFAIAVDATGAAYVTGNTGSPDFPTTAGAFDVTFNLGGADVFVTKLAASGSALVYSTFLGGSGFEDGIAIAADSSGHAYVAGRTRSTDFPATAGAFDETANFTGIGSSDAFVAKLNPDGSALVYSTYLGGSQTATGGDDSANGIAVDSSGNAYVTGSTERTVDFPTTAGAFDESANGSSDAFVTKLNAAGSALLYSTLLGGSIEDGGNAIAIDSAGNAYVIGQTDSEDFPTANPVQATLANAAFIVDAFVTKLDPTGSLLVSSTYLGGSANDFGRSLAVDAGGKAYITGFTNSADFPTTPGAFAGTFNGGAEDAFVAKLDLPDGAVGVAGGTVMDSGGTGAAFSVGPGVLTGGITVLIETISPPVVSPPAGFIGPATLFVNITLTPNPSPLPAPGATIRLPLALPLAPGTSLSLFRFDPVTSSLTDTGIVGTVDAGGATATFAGVTEFSIFVGFLAAPGCTPAPSGLISWWPGDGNPDDIRGGNNAVLSGGAGFGPGHVASAFSFNGTSSFVRVPDAANLSPAHVTVDFWVKSDVDLNGLSQHVPLLAKLNHGDDVNSNVKGYDFFYEFGGLRFGLPLPSGLRIHADFGVAIAAGTWHHVAGTYDGANQILYFDGVAVTIRPNNAGIAYRPADILVGTSRNTAFGPGEFFFNGQVDEIELFDRALSAAEVKAIFDAGSAGKCRTANRAPTAADQNLTTDEDTALAVTLAGSDPDGDTLTFTVASSPAHGKLSGTGASLTYTPDLDFNGSDSFTFKASDGALDSNVATVAITINAVNDAPAASAQSLTTPEDVTLAVTLGGSDVDGDPLTFAIVSRPANGLLAGSGASYTYTPNANFNGADSFTFSVSDGTLTSAAAVVSISVTPVNDPPVAVDDVATVARDSGGNTIRVLANDSFAPDTGETLVVIAVTPAPNGTVVIAPGGAAVLYQPNRRFRGSDSFAYTIGDGNGGTATANVAVTVAPRRGNGVDLEISQTASADRVKVGRQLTYTLRVRNNGPDDATGVIVSDILPQALTLLSATASQGSCAGGQPIRCDLGPIDAGDSAVVSLVVTPAPFVRVPTIVRNRASVDGVERELLPQNNRSEIATGLDPLVAVLNLGFTATPSPVIVQMPLTYTATVFNGGPDPATGVKLTISRLPVDVSVVSLSATQGVCAGPLFSTFQRANFFTCDLGTLDRGRVATVTLVVMVPTPRTLRVTAEVESNLFNPNRFGRQRTVTTQVRGPSADLGVSVSDTPDPVQAGADLTYRIGVTNRGPQAAQGVEVRAGARATVVSAVASQGSCNTRLVCGLGTLNAGAQATVTIVVRPTSAGLLRIAVSVSSSARDPFMPNNRSFTTTTVR